MKKLFRHYAIIWLIVLAFTNVLLFLTPAAGGNKFTVNFWLGYFMLTAVFVSMFLFCMFRSDDPDKIFYGLLLRKSARNAFLIIFSAGCVCVFVPFLTIAGGILICASAITLASIIFLRTMGAVSAAKEIGDKVRDRTSFMRTLTARAENLFKNSAVPGIKARAKEVYEAIRYSDPVSNDGLKDIEDKISLMFGEFSSAISNNDLQKASDIADSLLTLLSERNKKCKILK